MTKTDYENLLKRIEDKLGDPNKETSELAGSLLFGPKALATSSDTPETSSFWPG